MPLRAEEQKRERIEGVLGRVGERFPAIGLGARGDNEAPHQPPRREDDE